MRELLKSKIHRAKVTGTNLDYVGSVFIDKALMEKSNIVQYEKVLICNVKNGNRWETYALEADGGSGRVDVQGAGAKLCEVGDIVIILAFEFGKSPVNPKMILVDENNNFKEFL